MFANRREGSCGDDDTDREGLGFGEGFEFGKRTCLGIGACDGEEEDAEREEEEEEEEYSSDDDSEYTDDSDDDEEGVEEGGDAEKKEKAEEKTPEEEEQDFKKRLQDELADEEELWNFPPDREHWTEEDLGEHWEDCWGDTRAVGWDPNMISEPSKEKYEQLWAEGKPGPPGTPYYVPYRKHYPPIPDNHFDIQTPEDVVEELERVEEFLVWYSYLFKNGSSYEGTVWDDLAHGKGVYTTAFDIVRYEGEWFQNMMQGHGVIEADLPVDEPIPDSEEAIKAKEEGQILRSDYMEPFDREWLKMDLEEQFEDHGRVLHSWIENKGWLEEYEEMPEKGHYKYAGQWKNSRFHGCGVYEINGRAFWGKFYFGELLPDPEECNVEMSGFHASLAEVAAAKARMFVNKPDGMVRQVKGPFTDPSHPYMYEEEDLWMAPGFINAYYEVPEDWRVYVEDLDNEREMWLNSFMKAPFVIPMPPELEYMWSQDDEYVLLGNTPSAMLELNPENLERASDELQGEVLLHVPTGRIINWTTDAEGQLRFFYQPITENGEVIPEAIVPIPLGFDEYMKEEEDVNEKASSKKKSFFQRVKEEWDKNTEKYQKDREKRRENLQEKWKREDQVREFRQKLKKAERNLAFQIELEKIRAEKKSALKEEAVDQTLSDESFQEQPEEDGEAKTPEVDAEESKEEEGKEEEKNSLEDREDNEDDKKPRSFGKVAMAVVEDEPAGFRNNKRMSKERGSILPTAFASLTLGPNLAAGEVIKSKVGRVVADLFQQSRQFSLCHVSSDIQSGSITQEQKTSLHIRPCVSEDLRLRMSCVSRKPAHKTVHDTICSRQRQVCSRKARGGIGGRYLGKHTRRPQHQSSTDTIWKMPEFEFLSMAVPVGQ
eukprot:c22673_g4_i2 orf=824-3472(-)